MSLISSQDPGSTAGKQLGGRETKRSKKSFIFADSLILAFFLVAALTPSAYLYAGVFSFIGGLFTGSEAEAQSSNALNSQTVAVLAAARNIDPSAGRGGGDITILDGSALLSETGPSGSLADIEARAPSAGQVSLYVVREGDSLSQIAQMFGVSVNTIIWANDIQRGDVIHTGDTLAILPVSGVRHTVLAGETLASIAKKYNGNLEEIVHFNQLEEGTVLAKGDIIVIPDGEIAAPPSSAAGVASHIAPVGSSAPSYEGYYLRPVTNAIKTQGIHGYNGVDLAAPVGTPILASAEGDVIISRSGGWNGGYGNYVVIKHGNGTQTLYAHTSKNIVYVGQHVVQGQVIAYIGVTGKTTGPHLHFEVRGAKNPF